MRVQIRGVIYETVAEAAAALGVATSSVYCAISRGNLERLGLGQDYSKRPHKGGRNKKPINIGGMTFISRSALAAFIGRTPRSVRATLAAGPVARERLVLSVMKKVAKLERAALKEWLKDAA
jgi:hypothetical protein